MRTPGGSVRAGSSALRRGPLPRPEVPARSRPFKWLLDGAPKKDRAELKAARRSLDAALVDAGWRRIEPGPKWYAQGYVWPGAEAPGALHYTS